MIRDEETRHKMTQDTPMSPQTTHPKGSMLWETMTKWYPLQTHSNDRHNGSTCEGFDIQVLSQE
jgi:hypothetical protein